MQTKETREAEQLNIQYKKGVLELCVLAMLYREDCYGYIISENISKKIDIADGTVYPILRKLKSGGLVTTYLSEESGGPPRNTTSSPSWESGNI
jgi:PadR family transcriptional regulator PadR